MATPPEKLAESPGLPEKLRAAAGGHGTVLPVEKRVAYLHALEEASVGEDIAPFSSDPAAMRYACLVFDDIPQPAHL